MHHGFVSLSLPPSTRRRCCTTPSCRRRPFDAATLSGRRRAAMTASLDVAILLSGGGRSMENILDKIDRGELRRVNVKCVIASKASAGGKRKAELRGVPTHVVAPREHPSVEAFSDALSTILDEQRVDFAVLAGFMHFYLIPERYRNRVVNIHPSLIPAFCGKGYYGELVHQAVIDFGAKVSGCTVHFADNMYDHGPVILQRTVVVEETDDADALAARVFEEEKIALPQALQLLADQRVYIVDGGRRVKVLAEGLPI